MDKIDELIKKYPVLSFYTHRIYLDKKPILSKRKLDATKGVFLGQKHSNKPIVRVK